MDLRDSQQRMRQLIGRYYLLNRVPVGDETSRFVRELATANEAPWWSVRSGDECLTWNIPLKWTVRQASLATTSGDRIVDFADHPLYLKSYSAPFAGDVSRDELARHVVTDEQRPDRIIYDVRAQYAYGPRKEWGFSLPHSTWRELTDDQYRVNIDVEFTDGEMDVIDWTLPGERPETVFFAAHTCHPGQVNDGIACVAVLIELFRWLRERSNRRYTYRLILGPEYYAAAAVLARGVGVNELRHGVFLDMPGNGKPLGFSHSFHSDKYIDRVTENVLNHQVTGGFKRGYRKLWGNDEMFYDGPDFRISTVGIGRDHWPGYHTDADNLDNCDFDQLGETLSVLQAIVDVFESDGIPQRRYRGPLYQSRYDLYVDFKSNPDGYRALQDSQILMNGRTSCLDIAATLGVDYRFIRQFVEQLCDKNLAALAAPRRQ